MDLSSDPRWQRFNEIKGVVDIGYDHPDPWPHGNRSDSGQEVLYHGTDTLSADLCRWGEHRFIRCVLRLPIQGSDQSFAFGPWGSVNPANFDRFVQAELTGALDSFEGCFAWMMNRLPGFDMNDWLPCNLLIEDPKERPVLEVHDGSHALAQLQEDGISFDQLLDIYAAAGEDLRPQLLQS
ncbi:MAG: DUF2199 domain-containing protein [Paracoccaceae bacterium]